MTRAIRNLRYLSLLAALALPSALPASEAGIANHFILPCRDGCTTSRWIPAPGMAAARANHTATALPNGKVLVVGGFADAPLASAELYDPAANAWHPAANLRAPRGGHTATLLADGSVLVVGGIGDRRFLASAERYDPWSDTWRPAASLAEPRVFHTATLLPDGRVLVAGGSKAYAHLASAEIYDPASDAWTPAASLSQPRSSHVAASLPDGRVLVGGGGGGHPLKQPNSEVYLPALDRWVVAGELASLSIWIMDATATPLADGSVMLAGGGESLSDWYLDRVLRYDAAADTWREAASLASARLGHSATVLPRGHVLVAGGYNFEGEIVATERYDPANDAWGDAGDLVTPRAGHTATLLPNGSVLIAGGHNFDGALASVELYGSPAARSTIGPLRSTMPGGSARTSRAVAPSLP